MENGERRHQLALGLERVGLVPLRFPWAVLLVFVLLSVGAVFGALRVTVDDSLSQLFRSDTEDFRLYQEVLQRFPSVEYDVLVVVEGQGLLERATLEKLRDAVVELQLVDGTRGVISLFSARQPPDGDALPAPLFPSELPTGAEFEALIERVRANEIIRDKLLSRDGRLVLIVLALEPSAAQSGRLADVIGEVRRTLDETLAGTAVTARLAGVPALQLEIRNAVERDRLIYNTLGFAAGCAIAIFFFRRVSFMIVAAAPPLIAILLTLGVLGWLDFRLNMFLNIMTPLIMVIGFSDSMQLTFEARDRILHGEAVREAFRNAILTVGPACVLTHATAAISFTALLFSQSELIRSFGQAGLIAAVVALLAVLMLVPLLGVLLVRAEAKTAGGLAAADTAVGFLRGFCNWIARKMVTRPGLYSLISIGLVVLLGIVYLQLPPRYRLADQVPDGTQAAQANSRVDAQLTGANPIDVYIRLPPGVALYSPAALATLEDVHRTLEAQAGIGNVWSLITLRRWLAEKVGTSDIDTLKRYVELLPPQITERFVAAGQDAVLVSGRVPDLDASEILLSVERLDQALAAVRAAHPGTVIEVTGLSAVAARNSALMINRLSTALTVEILFVAGFIALAFRSVTAMLASILPGVFPIFLSGAVLWLAGEGLQFASVVALTVSFGLGLSATIHFLNRLRLEDDPQDGAGVAVERATVLMGPPLILTSVVLACGLAMTMVSDLPSLRLFGWLSALAMLAALFADLTILRPTITYLRLLTRKQRRGG